MTSLTLVLARRRPFHPIVIRKIPLQKGLMMLWLWDFLLWCGSICGWSAAWLFQNLSLKKGPVRPANHGAKIEEKKISVSSGLMNDIIHTPASPINLNSWHPFVIHKSSPSLRLRYERFCLQMWCYCSRNLGHMGSLIHAVTM